MSKKTIVSLIWFVSIALCSNYIVKIYLPDPDIAWLIGWMSSALSIGFSDKFFTWSLKHF